MSHLILDDAFISGRTYQSAPQSAAYFQLAGDWEALTENLAFTELGYGGEEAMRYAEYLRACTTPEVLSRFWAAVGQEDVTDILPLVKAPALVLQHRGRRPMTADEGKELATRIPNARLVLLEGKASAVDDVPRLVGEFLGDEAPGSGPTARRAAVRTILFTDIEGHTSMLHRLGDEAGREVLRDHERITREVLRSHGGTEVKTMGDGFMASFESATGAVECAVGLQMAFAARNEVATEPLLVRVGINAGEPIEENDDLFGTAVTMASRIMAQAQGGEILVSDAVRGLVSGKGFMFNDRGIVPLKGFEDPVRIYEVRWTKQ